MAKVYCQIDLIWLRDIKLISLVFHKYCDKLIADFGSMFSIISQTKLFSVHSLSKVWIFINLNALALNLLLPSDLIKALSEQDSIHKDSLVELFIDFLRDSE